MSGFAAAVPGRRADRGRPLRFVPRRDPGWLRALAPRQLRGCGRMGRSHSARRTQLQHAARRQRRADDAERSLGHRDLDCLRHSLLTEAGTGRRPRMRDVTESPHPAGRGRWEEVPRIQQNVLHNCGGADRGQSERAGLRRRRVNGCAWGQRGGAPVVFAGPRGRVARACHGVAVNAGEGEHDRAPGPRRR